MINEKLCENDKNTINSNKNKEKKYKRINYDNKEILSFEDLSLKEYLNLEIQRLKLNRKNENNKDNEFKEENKINKISNNMKMPLNSTKINKNKNKINLLENKYIQNQLMNKKHISTPKIYSKSKTFYKSSKGSLINFNGKTQTKINNILSNTQLIKKIKSNELSQSPSRKIYSKTNRNFYKKESRNNKKELEDQLKSRKSSVTKIKIDLRELIKNKSNDSLLNEKEKEINNYLDKFKNTNKSYSDIIYNNSSDNSIDNLVIIKQKIDKKGNLI